MFVFVFERDVMNLKKITRKNFLVFALTGLSVVSYSHVYGMQEGQGQEGQADQREAAAPEAPAPAPAAQPNLDELSHQLAERWRAGGTVLQKQAAVIACIKAFDWGNVDSKRIVTWAVKSSVFSKLLLVVGTCGVGFAFTAGFIVMIINYLWWLTVIVGIPVNIALRFVRVMLNRLPDETYPRAMLREAIAIKSDVVSVVKTIKDTCVWCGREVWGVGLPYVMRKIGWAPRLAVRGRRPQGPRQVPASGPRARGPEQANVLVAAVREGQEALPAQQPPAPREHAPVTVPVTVTAPATAPVAQT